MKIVQDPDIYSTWGVHGPFIQNWVFKCCYLVIIRVLTPAGSTPGLQPRGAEDPHPHVCLNELIVVLLPVFIWWLLSAGADRPVSHKLHQHLKSHRSEHLKVKPETLSQLQVESVTKYFLSSYKTSRSHVHLLLKYIYCQNCTFNIWDFYSSIIHTGDFCFSKVIF